MGGLKTHLICIGIKDGLDGGFQATGVIHPGHIVRAIPSVDAELALDHLAVWPAGIPWRLDWPRAVGVFAVLEPGGFLGCDSPLLLFVGGSGAVS
jgi:hypothetical protein